MIAGALSRRFPRRPRPGAAAGRPVRVACRTAVIAALEAQGATRAVAA